jgi:hypothetical protein
MLRSKLIQQYATMPEKWIPKTSTPGLPSNTETDSDKEREPESSVKSFDKIRPLNELK